MQVVAQAVEIQTLIQRHQAVAGEVDMATPQVLVEMGWQIMVLAVVVRVVTQPLIHQEQEALELL